jgi:arylsulfatase A-like enzyme
MHFYEVHEYNPPAEYFARFRSQTEPSRFEHEPDFKRDLMSSFYQGLPDADRRYIVAKYDGSLAYVDAELGRLFAWLRDTNQYDNTMVVVTADHGAEFWDHNGTGHGFTLYDEQLHVPLIVKAPGSAGRGRRVADNAASIDIVPTILAFVGLPAPPFMQGISLRPAMETGAAPAARSLFAEDTTLFNSYAKVDGSLKYIENRVPPADLLNLGLLFANVRSFYRFRANELFRLDRDPREQANVLGSDRDTGARMRAELLAHIAHPVDRTEMRMDDQTIKRLRSLGYIK